ncbi:hypothetical protein OG225_17140 [Nocardia sp. NBC_01377]|uniref:hypothetical protein n=1 Tax=Nocardia sp. NBC_01377 TaxID=2903595 RepID=UPI003249BE32
MGASTIDHHDTAAWLGRLKAGTTPQLAAEFDAGAQRLEQILLPLQWTSTATPLSAAVTVGAGGVYKVNVYLNVNSTSVQTTSGAVTAADSGRAAPGSFRLSGAVGRQAKAVVPVIDSTRVGRKTRPDVAHIAAEGHKPDPRVEQGLGMFGAHSGDSGEFP